MGGQFNQKISNICKQIFKSKNKEDIDKFILNSGLNNFRI